MVLIVIFRSLSDFVSGLYNNLKLPLILHSFCILDSSQDPCLLYSAKIKKMHVLENSGSEFVSLGMFEIFLSIFARKAIITIMGIIISMSTLNLQIVDSRI